MLLNLLEFPHPSLTEKVMRVPKETIPGTQENAVHIVNIGQILLLCSQSRVYSPLFTFYVVSVSTTCRSSYND